MTGSDSTGKPEITLLVKGRPVTFLCDSGACRTVIIEGARLGINPGPKTILVRAANGKAISQPISYPIPIELEETSTEVMAPVVLFPQCPYNLLGRDLMTKLQLAIFPTRSGGMEARPCSEADVHVLEGEGEPMYEWCLELPSNDPGQIKSQIMQEAKTAGISHPTDTDLRVVIRQKGCPGPDEAFEEKFSKIGPTKVIVEEIIWDGKVVACLVTVPKEVPLGTGEQAYIPLTLDKNQMITRMLRKAKYCDWQGEGKLKHSPTAGLDKKRLGWVVRTTPGRRLYEQENA